MELQIIQIIIQIIIQMELQIIQIIIQMELQIKIQLIIQIIPRVKTFYTSRERCEVLTGCFILGRRPGGDWANT
jgi:hypothetical protein